MKTIGITGGTGFVGTLLTRLLVGKGYDVVIFTRNKRTRSHKPNIDYIHWDAAKGIFERKMLAKLDAVVNLAGAGIADKRWKKKRKKEIRDSRIMATDFLVEKLKAHAPLCKTFVSASAIGFYGPDMGLHTPFTETAPAYDDFLGNTCKQWEDAAAHAGAFARTVILRFGVVLGKESGAFPKFAQPVSMGIAPVLGSGGQEMSWIEVSDLCRLITFSLENESISGIYNAVAPHPVSQRELITTIATEKGGGKLSVHVPSALLGILLGEMSLELLKSCTVSAQKIMNAGFTFHHPDIVNTIRAILGRE